MDLPSEIRNKIYKLALPTNVDIELWPDNYMQLLGLPTRGNKLYEYQNVITRQLKLLRVSKHINAETSSLFYKTNIFHFSGQGGWQVLAAFLLTIGSLNAGLLRTVCI